MAGKLAAVLGTGQTKYVAKRHDVSMNGLVREAIDRALADADSTFDDIDAVVVGKAPDFFEGVRAAVIDKDRNPKWNPARLADVSAADLDSFFTADHAPLFQDHRV